MNGSRNLAASMFTQSSGHFQQVSSKKPCLRSKRPHEHKGSYKPWFLESSLSWAVEAERRILMFMWSFGRLPVPEGAPSICSRDRFGLDPL